MTAAVRLFGTNDVTTLVDKSKKELGHHKVVENKDKEVKSTRITRSFNSQVNNQKTQFAMKRGRNNMKQNFKHHPLA